MPPKWGSCAAPGCCETAEKLGVEKALPLLLLLLLLELLELAEKPVLDSSP